MYLSQYEFLFDNKIREILNQEKDSTKLEERRNSLFQAKFVASSIWNRLYFDIISCAFTSITLKLYKERSQISVVRDSGNVITPVYSVKGVDGEDVLKLIHTLIDNYIVKAKVIIRENDKYKDLIIKLDGFNNFKAEKLKQLKELE